jgi:NAD(P)-dependent dehydrogenase (short-subunit alcohol dehydrogenase family)
MTLNWIIELILIPFKRHLAGKTIFISGASRGIGKAIALRCARDGANVIIAAKTADPHPKLPGTIYSAAKESRHLVTQAKKR